MPLVLRTSVSRPLTHEEVDGNFTYLNTKPSNISGGVLGSVPYQTATNTTGLLDPGTAGYALTTNGAGSAPTWTKIPVIGVDVQAYDADLTTWAGITAPNGSVVGTTDTQTLSNKTLSAPVLTGSREVRVALSGNTIDIAAGNYFTKTISGAATLAVSNVPSTGIAASFILELTNGGSATITWWASIKWSSGVAPVLTTSGRDVLAFFTHDGGTTWTGILVSRDAK